MRNTGWTNKLLAGFIVALLRGSTGNAQIQSNATCASTFTWAANSLNQSPCLVAAYLQGACSTGVWTTPALPHPANGTTLAYNSPDASSRNLCTCSWAVYNLMSACAACQDGAWVQWPVWTLSCQTATDNLISSQAFPPQVPVPPGTVIPEYAGKDPSTWTGGLFNATEARAIGSHNIQITTSASSTGTAPNTSNTSSANSDGGPAAGPIVGGVVGGLLGLLLIAVLGTFLLCPALFRRGQVAGAQYPPTKQENQPVTLTSQIQPVGGIISYDASTAPTGSQQGLIAPGPLRPRLAPRFTSSEYSFGTSLGHSAASSMALQPVQQAATNSVPYNHPPGSTPSLPNPNVHTFGQETSVTDQDTSSSVRGFFTRAVPRHGHAHTPSDTSVTSASSLLPRIQQGLWRQQSGSGNNVVVPYITTSAASTSSTAPSRQHQFPVDRKTRPTGLQYTPPPDVRPFSFNGESSILSEGSTINIGMSPTLLPPGAFISTPTATENVYGMAPSNLVTDEDLETDRRTNMSPANTSSILEAAPPYPSDDQHDLEGRGMPLRRTPRLPDVDEYPEEKARFTNARVDRPV